jgi:hypothetical protein
VAASLNGTVDDPAATPELCDRVVADDAVNMLYP